MKTPFQSRRMLKLIGLPCAALLVVFAAAARVQTSADAPPAATNDVSQFPPLDKLPGKVPSHVWTGLGGVWARDHARWKQSAATDAGAVVFLGDSITEGWSSLEGDFSKLKVANRGIGGDITSGVLYRLYPDVLSLNPAAIVLLIGTNDVGDGADAEDVAANTKLILQAIKNFNPKLKVIVCKIMPRAERNGGPVYSEKIQKANALIEAYVKTEPNFTICDTWTIFVADDKGNPIADDFKADKLHLNAAGYVVWKKALDPIIANLHLETAKSQ